MNKRRIACCLFAALFIGGCSTTPSETPSASPAETVTLIPVVRGPLPSTRFIAVGDTMLGSDFPADRLPPDDGRGLLDNVVSILRAGDVSFVNVEGVLMDGGEPAKQCDNPSLCYLFRSPSRFAKTLQWAGFDVASLANNHARDFGEIGRSASMRALDDVGIAHTGREGDIASIDVNAVRIAVVGFAPNVGSWSINDIESATHLVAGLSVGHDVVVVSFHGGAEGADALHVTPGMESYYGEARGDLIRFSHAVIDAGADLVIGHGPHVPRALELYRDRLIAYSLGNFATHWGISVGGRKGYAPILDVTLSPEGRFESGRIHAAIQRRPDGVFIDPERNAIRLMQQLMKDDFPATQLQLNDDGTLTVRKASAAARP